MSKFDVSFVDDKPQISNKISSFFITVNTQKAYTEVHSAQAAKAELKLTLKPIFDNINEFIDVYIKEPGDVRRKLDVTPDQVNDLIINGEIRTSFEVGGQKHRLHSHSIVKIEHQDYIFRMNLKKIREHLPKGYHLDVKFISDHQRAMSIYMSKTLKMTE